ncbi:MAG: hypothetical protein ACREBD_02510 [Blastocatellia bacterium]
MKTTKAKPKAARARKLGSKKSAKAKTSARRKEQIPSIFEPLTNNQAPNHRVESEPFDPSKFDPLAPIPEEVLKEFEGITFLKPPGKPDKVARDIIRAMREYFREERAAARKAKASKRGKKASTSGKDEAPSVSRNPSSPKKPKTRQDVAG